MLSVNNLFLSKFLTTFQDFEIESLSASYPSYVYISRKIQN